MKPDNDLGNEKRNDKDQRQNQSDEDTRAELERIKARLVWLNWMEFVLKRTGRN